MLFSSTFFLIYFLPVFFTIYFLLPQALKNYFIVLASALFYAWGAPQFVYILLSTVIFNFVFAHLIVRTTSNRKRYLLWVSVIVNLSLLLFFKYANFFVENVNAILETAGLHPYSFTRIALPIGISFFTFHQLSFIIDVYRGVKPPMKKISDYALYILLFPQLIAGPIIRYNEIADQIQSRNKKFDVDIVLSGFLRFAIGLAKKVLIANVLGNEADRIFSLPTEHLDFMLSWVGALTYTFQIYFDFSGYSDMAIGLAKMMGFIFPENFNNPYIAQSITDFWRRWHISLSRWMKDYLYIPLGGNKVSETRLYINLWIVFLVSGFWHGAEWTFVLWGAYHGFFLVIDRLFLLKIMARINIYLRVAITFLITVIGWVIFRAATVQQAFTFLKKMFSFSSHEYLFEPRLSSIFLLAFILSFLPLVTERITRPAVITRPAGFVKTFFSIIVILVFITLSVGEITSSGFNPFIYFKF
jgi:alginate O-acetyltransferase complex protein AlgI